MTSVWCVKHNSGWCAADPNRAWDDARFNVRTKCGHFIVLPLGGQKGRPTCLECLKALELTADQRAGE